MINIPIDIRCLEGFDFFDVLLPSNTQKNKKLILQFSNVGKFLEYQENLMASLKVMRCDESLSFDMGMQNKIKFVEKILISTMSKTVAVILKRQ
jgi:hypothetical protein